MLLVHLSLSMAQYYGWLEPEVCLGSQHTTHTVSFDFEKVRLGEERRGEASHALHLSLQLICVCGCDISLLYLYIVYIYFYLDSYI